MENNTESNATKILVVILICIIIASVAATFIYLYNSPKFIMSQITNKISTNISKYTNEALAFNNREIEAHTAESTINIDVQGLESPKVLKLSSNVNPENEYNIYKLKKENDKEIINLYNNKSLNYIDLAGYDKFISIESKSLSIDDYKYSFDAFEKVFNELRKQLTNEDFYKLKVNNEEGKSKNRIQVGIILPEKRYNEMIINSLEVLKTDKDFIKDIIAIYNITNQDNTIELNEENTKKKIEEFIEELKKTEISENSNIKISFTVSGLLREKIEKIEIVSQEGDSILWSISSDIGEKQAEMTFELDGKSYAYIMIREDAENVYSINIKDSKEKANIYDVNLGITGDDVFTFNGIILENKFSGGVKLETDSNKKLNRMTANLEIGNIKLNAVTNLTYQKISENITMKPVQEYTVFLNSQEASNAFQNILLQIAQ